MISAKLSLELSMNGCRKAKVIITRNIEYNSKINIFLQEILALLKSIHVKNVIEKKTSWSDKKGMGEKHTHTHPPSPLTKGKDEYVLYFVDHILIVFVVHCHQPPIREQSLNIGWTRWGCQMLTDNFQEGFDNFLIFFFCNYLLFVKKSYSTSFCQASLSALDLSLNIGRQPRTVSSFSSSALWDSLWAIFT